MIHNISPKTYSVEYFNHKPEAEDIIIMFNGENVVCHLNGNEATLPKYSEFPNTADRTFVYLFSIDDQRYFLAEPLTGSQLELPPGYEFNEFGIFRDIGPRYISFAIVTAQHLNQWYKDRVYCGKCGAKTTLTETERSCICPKCRHLEYPKLSPCIIVAVTHGEFLLLTRYKNRPYKRYALIAGFVEIGESLEDAVCREVFEETGVKVKNIKYYKSQPWGFTSTLLMGFFCQLDGDPTLTIDEDELSEAVWLQREAVPPAISDIALTSEMMEVFRLGQMG